MASRNHGGEESALGDPFRQAAQGLLGLQETLRLQEQRSEAALRQMEQQLQQRDEAIRALLDERMQQVEARMKARMGNLEEAVQRALSTVFPKVDALVAQLEKSTPCPSCASLSTACPQLPAIASTDSVSTLASIAPETSVDTSSSTTTATAAAVAVVAAVVAVAAAVATTTTATTTATTSTTTTTAASTSAATPHSNIPSPIANSRRRRGARDPTASNSSTATSSSLTVYPTAGCNRGAEAETSAAEEAFMRQFVEHRIRDARALWKRARAVPFYLGKDLHYAAHEGRLEDVRHLLDRGADVNAILNWRSRGATPLISVFCFTQERRGDLAVVALLLQRGANVHAIATDGKSALHCAAGTDSSGQCVALLIAAGANVDDRDADGGTPLHWAASCNNMAGVRVLVAAGARKDIKGWSHWWEDKTVFDLDLSGDVLDLLRR